MGTAILLLGFALTMFTGVLMILWSEKQGKMMGFILIAAALVLLAAFLSQVLGLDIAPYPAERIDL